MKVLITGVGGQDGSYLAELLLEKGYEVHGLVRRSSVDNTIRVGHLLPRLVLHRGDVTDASSVERILADVRPNQVYHLADQDVVGWSFESPAYSADVTYGGVARVLEGVRRVVRNARVLIPCSATVFGHRREPSTVETSFDPQSPYACAKAGAYYLAHHYRRHHKMFISVPILYGHCSPRQKSEYLLHKIAKHVVGIAKGSMTPESVILNDSGMKINIGCPSDYVVAMKLMIECESPVTDVVCRSGQVWSIAQLYQRALTYVGLPVGMYDRFTVRDSTSQNEKIVNGIHTSLILDGWSARYNTFDVLESLINHYDTGVA